MSKPPAFQFYANDFLAATAEWEPELVGAYIRLLSYQWINGSIPSEEKKLKRITGLDVIDMEFSKTVRTKFDIETQDGRLMNLRLENTREDQQAYRQKMSDLSKLGVEARRIKKEQSEQPHDEPHGKSIDELDGEPLQSSSSTSSSTAPSDSTSKKKRGLLMKDVFNPFEETQGFESLWELWLDYRTEKRISKYKPIGLQGAYKKLWEISGGDLSIATKIIHESISNGWTGFFELKSNGKQQQRITRDSVKEFLAKQG